MKIAYNNILLAVNLEDHCMNSLKEFVGKVDLTDSVVHLVHIFEIKHFVNEFASYSFPEESNKESVKDGVLNVLVSWEKELFNNNKMPKKVINHCLFHGNPKDAMVEYANEHKIDLMVVPTRGKSWMSGIFSSSFANHMCQFTKCAVLSLK